MVRGPAAHAHTRKYPPDPKFALAELDVFKGLSAEEYRLVETIVRPLIFDKGEVIIREGDQAKLFFVLARGTVSVQIRVPTRRENGSGAWRRWAPGSPSARWRCSTAATARPT